jgi:hypothetical protein
VVKNETASTTHEDNDHKDRNNLKNRFIEKGRTNGSNIHEAADKV